MTDLASRLAHEIDRFKRNIEMYATNPADPLHKLSFRMTEKEAETVLASLRARSALEASRG